MAADDLEFLADDVLHGNSRPVLIPGKQSDLDVTSPFAETKDGVRTCDRTAESINRKVGTATSESVNLVDHSVIFTPIDHSCRTNLLSEIQDFRLDVHRYHLSAQ